MPTIKRPRRNLGERVLLWLSNTRAQRVPGAAQQELGLRGLGPVLGTFHLLRYEGYVKETEFGTYRLTAKGVARVRELVAAEQEHSSYTSEVT